MTLHTLRSVQIAIRVRQYDLDYTARIILLRPSQDPTFET